MPERITLRRATGASVSLAAHGLLLAAILLTFRTFRRPPEPKAVTIELLPRLAAPELAPKRPAPAAAGRGPQPVRPQAPSPPRAGAGAAPSPTAAQPGPSAAPGQGQGQGQDLQGVRAALRDAVGCGHDRFLQLTEAERVRCAERLGKGADPNVAWPAPIAPEKRAWFDASVRAHNSPGRPPGIGCALLFGKGKLVAPKATHALKLGPLPCYILPPKGPLTDEVDVEPPSRQRPDQGFYPTLPAQGQEGSGPRPPG